MRCGRESRSKHQLPLSTHAPVFHWDLFFFFLLRFEASFIRSMLYIKQKKGIKASHFFPFLQRPVFRVVQRNEGLFIAGTPSVFSSPNDSPKSGFTSSVFVVSRWTHQHFLFVGRTSVLLFLHLNGALISIGPYRKSVSFFFLFSTLR